MADYKEKIKKLLALSKSPNEHEAQAALTKAQQLMAEHKISMAEVQDVGKREALEKKTGVTFSARRDPWILRLSNIIAENYCCKAISYRESGKQTQSLYFVGLDEDIEICMIAFNYASDCIRSEIKDRSETGKLLGYPHKTILEICNGYAYGFLAGLKEAFEEQKSEAGWGLVLSLPSEVNEKLKEIGIKTVKFKSKQASTVSKKDYDEGKKDGREFDITKRVSAEG